jgi:NADPH2:quinone reductase
VQREHRPDDDPAPRRRADAKMTSRRSDWRRNRPWSERVTWAARKLYAAPAAIRIVAIAATAFLGLFVINLAWFALRERARLETGETVLVLGASGGVGRAAVQLAHEMGARVLAGVVRPDRAASVRAAGADAMIDLSAEDLRDSLRAQVYAVTEGRGADIILDPLGGAIFEAAVRALAWRGRLVVIGFAAGAIPAIRTNYLLLKNIEISGLQISDYRKRRPAQVAACFAEIFSLYDRGKVKPAAATVFPLARAGEALAMLRDRSIIGRAVLQLRDD